MHIHQIKQKKKRVLYMLLLYLHGTTTACKFKIINLNLKPRDYEDYFVSLKGRILMLPIEKNDRQLTACTLSLAKPFVSRLFKF